ncbi:NeuD/PglB/VioB family sugar acetyltransferase [Sphingorhabdus sp. Alg231-15]|uniref:NeuD/PglB/VioB family sugar acetyltransferase n=1 Tax=Sphingorhabdus sp. Alg231-15 TaxID=1922222 RepID=UPI000D55EAC2
MTSKKIIAVYGKSGFGREVMPLVSTTIAELNSSVVLFVDDSKSEEVVNGYPVWSYADLISKTDTEKYVVIAIADAAIRRSIARKCEKDSIKFLSIVASNHIRMDSCTVGEGAIFSSHTVLTSNIQIGKHFHCNIYSYVAHDCVIGDYVTFAPGVKCNGNVHIDDNAYIGTGAILKQGTSEKPLRIGKGAVVGMGAVVTKDVADGAIVIGNPAIPMAN